jgi:hypothetical protein
MNHELSVHKTYVFPARPRVGGEGDAAILRFLERQGYLAERLAAEDAVSDIDGSRDAVHRRLPTS